MSDITEDRCPKCGGKVIVLERSLEYWGGIDCVSVEEQAQHELQQLKAEISAMINWYNAPMGYGGNTVNRTQLLDKLRQLSASSANVVTRNVTK